MRRYLILFAISFFSCQNEQPISNREMADLLKQLEQKAFSSPLHPYANNLRAQNLGNTIGSLPYSVPFEKRLTHIRELLSAGDNETGVQVAEKVTEGAFPDGRITRISKPYFEILALAYLRQGEQENCLDHHNSYSCIVPIEKGGIHSNKLGSQKAIALYGELLEYDSTDLQSRWLYNIAQMTSGNYPDEVPKRWLIPEQVFSSDYEIPYFPDIAHQKGLDILGHAGSCSMEDFNNDGRLDVFITSYLLGDQCRLFFQQFDGSFKEVTESAKLIGITGGLNTIHADYNNDGYVDILILRGGWLQHFGVIPNSLLRNNGDGSFTDVTKEAGLFSSHPTQTAAWADFNLDGYLDLFIGNESTAHNRHPAEFYLNNGDGTFKEIAETLQLNITAFIKSVIWGDFNNDRLPDLYISILGDENRLYMNRGGTNLSDWHFEEIGATAGIQEPIFSFPGWVWDYNNDGFEDILVSGYYGEDIESVTSDVVADYLGIPNNAEKLRLFKNNGDETFTEVSKELGLDKVLFTMGCNYGDLDNDGWLDAYFGTGEMKLWSVVPNRMFRNAEGKKFQDVTTSGGFGQIQKGHGVSFGDIDNDGDQDIYTVIGGALKGDIYYNMLFENPGNINNWVTLQLEGTTANRKAIGSRVKLTVENIDGQIRNIYRTVSTGGSFGNNSLHLEIGLGKSKKIVEVEVKWANTGKVIQTWKDLEINSKHILVEQ